MIHSSKAGLYIHIPFCTHKCGYCSFYSVVGSEEQMREYVDALFVEAKLEHSNPECIEIDTIYLGGGTPSVLPRGEIARILNFVRGHYNVSKDCEITIEANPESVSEEFACECASAGVNRVSLGLQSDDDVLLKRIYRGHTYKDFLLALERFLKAGITNISVDLISGLPSQSLKDLMSTAKNVAQLPIKHISLYALTIDKEAPFHTKNIKINPDIQADMYEKAVDIFKKADFSRYEVSNFAKKGFHSRHNSKYWSHENYLALGISASSFFDDTRKKSTNTMEEYLKNDFKYEKNLLTNNDKIFEHIMLALRTTRGIDVKMLKDRYDYDIFGEKYESVDMLISQKLLIYEDGYLKCSQHAFYIQNQIVISLI